MVKRLVTTPEEDDAKTLCYMDQYVAELGAQMANDYIC
jgi:hypothetical protein